MCTRTTSDTIQLAKTTLDAVLGDDGYLRDAKNVLVLSDDPVIGHDVTLLKSLPYVHSVFMRTLVRLRGIIDAL